MKHYTWSKKLIALVCVVSLLLGSIGLQAFAGNEDSTEKQNATLAEVSLTDMGIASGTYTGEKTFDVQKTTNVALLNAKTSMYITLDASTGSALYFGGPDEYWVGPRLRVTNTGTLSLEHTGGESIMPSLELDATKVGLTSFMNTKFKLTFELYKDGKNAKLGFYINDILYDGKYITVKDANLGNRFYIALNNAADSVVLEEPLQDLDLPQITLSQMGIEPGLYSGRGTFAINKTTDVSLMNAETTMYITFNGSKNSYIDFAVYDNWYGLRLRVGDEGKLYFEHTSDSMGLEEELVPAKAGVTSFFGTKMKLSFVLYKENNEVRVRLYFNDRLYDNKYFVVQDETLLGNGFNIALAQDTDYIDVEEPLADLELPQISLTELGIEAKTYTGEKRPFAVAKTTNVSFKNVMTSMYMTLNASTNSYVNFATYDNWYGLRLRVADGGKVYFEHTDDALNVREELEPTKVGLTNFLGTRIKFAFAIYEENNETRVRLYINDKLYDNKYYVISDATKLGTGFNIALTETTNSVILDEVVAAVVPSEPLEDLELPEVGLADMGIATGTYDGKGTFAVLKKTDVSLKNVITTMYITLNASQHSSINFASYDHWYGLRLRVADGGKVYFEHTDDTLNLREELNPAKVGLTSFMGTRMKLSFALYEEDNETRVRLYINDKLYGNKYYVVSDPAKLGDGFNIALYEDSDSIVLEEAKPVPIPGELTLPKVSLEKMGIAAGTYDGKGTFAVLKSTEEPLMNAMTTMYITLNASKHSYVNFAVYEHWNGLRLRVGDEGKVYFEHTDDKMGLQEQLDPTKVGLTSFMDTRMKLTFALYEEDNETRVRLYIDDKLYDNKYWVVKDPTKLGDGFSIALSQDTDSLILEEAYIVENAMRDYTVLTYTDFGYGKTTALDGDEMLKVKSSETLYNDAIEGYYSFTKDSGYVFFGGQWCGVGLHVNEVGELEVSYANPNVSHTVIGKITSEDTGFTFDTPNLLIKTGFAFYDVNAGRTKLKVTVRVADSFEKSFWVDDVDINNLLERIFVYTDKDTTLGITAAEKSTSEPQLKKITLYMLGVENKSYNYNKTLVVDGAYEGSLLNTITTMNIKLNAQSGTYFQIGGQTGWEGFRLSVEDDGTLRLSSTSGGMSEAIITPEMAGVSSFLGEDMKISYKIMESGNDVKLGLYFNGKLYGNKYFVMKNGKAKLGSHFGIYLKNEQDIVSVWCEPEVPIPVDFTEFGFTNNWAVELGLKKR